MADPSLQSLCCLEYATNGNHSQQYLLLKLHEPSYHELCLASAVLGCLGSLYQLRLRYRAPFPRYQYFNVGLRGNNILFWLALTDLFAGIGLIARSIAWLVPSHKDHLLGQVTQPMHPTVCAIVSGWIQLAFTCSHFWTLIYAIDVRRITYDLPYATVGYHSLAWGGSVILCTAGLTLLYVPGISGPHLAYIHLLPNHVATYLPMFITCLGCPILFQSAFRQAGESLQRRHARYTATERRLIDGLRTKFFMITAVFYLCWMPNLINGLALWIAWSHLPLNWILGNWYLMAVLNPLQAVFNLLLYKSPKKRRAIASLSALREWWTSIRLAKRIEADEDTPLLL